uniref:Major facilitator superfamily domain-containing protein 9-like n=1 Tax=Saccoglossus kowalevskii TaxID=10224 RepID=A0ABM0N0U9_SACKO|nr:PREDICTED: major facilitator superfamily domain-containing protein 9-like [Saccoglossus kowalevskii]
MGVVLRMMGEVLGMMGVVLGMMGGVLGMIGVVLGMMGVVLGVMGTSCDFLGVAMIIPLLPGHTKSMGASSTMIGLGKWSDVVGRRWSLLWCFAFSSVGYVMLGFSSTILILMLSRIPSGIFKHTMSLSKAYLTDITPADERPAVYGTLNSISGIGFIIGPVLGGHIAETDNGFMRVCLCSATMFFLDLVITWYFIQPIPEDKIKRSTSEKKFALEDLNLNPITFFRTFSHILTGQIDLFIIRFLLGFAALLYRSNFTLMLENEYGTSPKTNGYIISMGSAVAVLSGMFVGHIIRLYNNEAKLLIHAGVMQVLAIIFLTFSPNIWFIMILLAPLSLSNSIARVCCTDLSVRRGRVTEVGAVIGLSQTVMSVARMLTPFLGGVLQEFSYQAPGVVAAAFAMAGTTVMVIYPQDQIKYKKH